MEKKIPIGSGLGGPSSDAATVLKATFQNMESYRLPMRNLIGIGRSIGADVPLFFYGKPCIMEGIGDIITPVDTAPFFGIL